MGDFSAVGSVGMLLGNGDMLQRDDGRRRWDPMLEKIMQLAEAAK